MKYLFLIITLIIIVSCKEFTIPQPKPEPKKLPGYPKVIIINDTEFNIFLGSDDHEYILGDVHDYVSQNIALHYIDCKLCRQRNNLKPLP